MTTVAAFLLAAIMLFLVALSAIAVAWERRGEVDGLQVLVLTLATCVLILIIFILVLHERGLA